MINPDTQHFMAERMNAHVRSYQVDHTPIVTAPDAVVHIIGEAMRSVTVFDSVPFDNPSSPITTVTTSGEPHDCDHLSFRRRGRPEDVLPRGRRPDAPKLLLLHGFPSSSHMFRDLIPQLADRFHIVAPDLPGFGQSDMPARSSSPTRSTTSPTSSTASPR